MKRIAGLVLSMALVLVLGAPTASAATNLKIATLNLCGSACLAGELTNTASKVGAQARSLGVDAFVLNEVCAGQYDAIKANLGSGWSTYYTTTTDHAPCKTASDGSDNRFGNALMVKGTLSAKAVTALPCCNAPVGSTGREPRALLCATAVMRSVSLRLCTTHLSPNSADNGPQAAQVVSTTKPQADAGKLVLGGDMNAQPGSTTINNYLAYLRSTNTGHRPTEPASEGGKEIDWVLTNAGVTGPATTATHNAGSDHFWLIGPVTV